MSLAAHEKSESEEHAHVRVPRMEQERASDSPTLSAQSISGVSVSGLGSGALPLTGPVVKEKEPTSAELLADMAQPKVFQGPEVDLVKTISERLETAITALDQENPRAVRDTRKQENQERYFAALRAVDEEQDPDAKAAMKARATLAHRHGQAALPMEKYALDDALYIGSIVLTDIPATTEGEAALLERAELEFDPDQALNKAGSAVAVPKRAGVEREVVRLILQTMIKAGQFDYLRKSGFVGRDWKVIVEVHYYRSRSKKAANLHKDTLGQTLFVNLNYTNEGVAPGPEWIINPPLVGSHEEHIEEQLPGQFMADLETIRGSTPTPTMIETGDLPAYGVVSFVDEAIHHATPLLGHREVRGTSCGVGCRPTRTSRTTTRPPRRRSTAPSHSPGGRRTSGRRRRSRRGSTAPRPRRSCGRRS